MSAVFEGGGERDPFSLTANPDGYVPTANVGRVLGDANVCLDEGRVPLVFGPAGLGKTLVLQLLGRERSDRSLPLYVPFCNLPPQELASLALGLLGEEVGEEPEAQLLEEAQRLRRGGRSLLLLIDDASALPGETAAQLAHWANASDGALQIALAGLPGAALRHVCDAFGDRAEEILHAGGLRSEEIGRYVRARLEGAGADPSLLAAFDERALAELERVSEGNPRKLHLAAQAIVRNAQHREQVREAERHGRENGGAPEATRSPLAPTARDLGDVGAYRFVGGRFIDPDNGTPLDEEAAPEAEPARASGTGADPSGIPSGVDLTLAAATAPAAGAAASARDREPPAESDALRPDTAPPRLPYAAIALGVVLVAFAVGLLTQLTGERDGETAQAPARVMTPDEVSPGRQAAPPEVAPETPPEVARGEAPAAPAAPGSLEVEPAEDAAEDMPAADPRAETPAAARATREAGTPVAVAEGTAPAVPSDAEAGAPEAEGAEAPPADVAPPVAETVSVSINATPWAVIEIDGEEVGETPLAGIELTTGRHRFRARMPDGDVRERVERIDAGNRTVVFE